MLGTVKNALEVFSTQLEEQHKMLSDVDARILKDRKFRVEILSTISQIQMSAKCLEEISAKHDTDRAKELQRLDDEANDRA